MNSNPEKVSALTAHDEAREHLGNLLAIIHGDGGHYQAEHGNEKATTDAIAKYYELRAKHDEALPGDWETVDRDGVYGNVIDKTTGKRIFTYVDLRDCDRATAAHNSALRVLVDALRSAKCPACDGSGGIPVQTSERQYVTREMAMDAGNPEMEGSLYSEEAWEQQQCQWCDERNKALQPYSGQKDGKP